MPGCCSTDTITVTAGIRHCPECGTHWNEPTVVKPDGTTARAIQRYRKGKARVGSANYARRQKLGRRQALNRERAKEQHMRARRLR